MDISISLKNKIIVTILFFVSTLSIVMSILIEDKTSTFRNDLVYEKDITGLLNTLKYRAKWLQEISTDILAMGEDEDLKEVATLKEEFLNILESLKVISNSEDIEQVAKIRDKFENYYSNLYKMAQVGVDIKSARDKSKELMDKFDSASENLTGVVENLPKLNKDTLAQIKYDIKFTQEALTDALAVGDDEGIKESHTLKEKILKLINSLKLGLGDKTIFDKLENLKKAYIDMQKIGLEMANQGVIVNEKMKEAREVMEVVDSIVEEYQGTIEAIVSKKDEKLNSIVESTKDLNNFIKTGLFIIIGIIIVVGIISFFMLSGITKRVKELEKILTYVTDNRDFTKDIKVYSKDEIGSIRATFNILLNTLKLLFSNIKDTSHESASIANELSTTSLQIGHRVENEAQIVDTIAKSFKEMENLLNSSIDDAYSTKQDISEASLNLEEARSEILSMVAKISETSKVESELANKLNQLSTDAEQVKSVLTVINDIADQTNLLALNAAIEAARAGEHGKGFAVVADEVRQLAERTQKSLVEINSTINVIVQAIIDTSEEMNKNSKAVIELSNSSYEVEHKVNDTSEIMKKSEKIAENSLIVSKQIVDDIKEKITKIEEVNLLASSNARSVEEVAMTAKHLHQITEELNAKLGEFKT